MDHQFLLVAAAGLAIMIAASVFSRRTGVAAPLLLVGLGIAASYLPSTPTIVVEPELVLAGVLPPLLYSSAVNLPVIEIQRNFGLIVWLSVVMVVVSALVIGAVVHAVFPSISFALGTALGATVSPTDAVAATAIGRRVGLPPRLMSVLEGESLVNDASALVLLRTAIAAVAATSGFSLGRTVLDFAWAVAGAVLVGTVVGVLTVRLRQRLDDPVLNTTISFAVPFLAYFPAEQVHASGVLTVVVAGLVTGAQGSRRFSARDRQTQATTWTTISFILESGVFLAMGYQLPELIDAARDETTTTAEISGLVLLVVGLLIVLRFVGLAQPALAALFGDGERARKFRTRLEGFEERIEEATPHNEKEEGRLARARTRLARGRADVDFEEREPITVGGSLVLGWAGMRGVVTVAAVQTIPATSYRATVVLAAFLVALVTLVLFGLTLPSMIRRMAFPSESPEERRDAVSALMQRIGDSAVDELGPLEEQTVDGESIDPEIAEQLKTRFLPRIVAGVQEIRDRRPDAFEQAIILQRRYVDAMRDALNDERRIGAYSSQTYQRVEQLLDNMEQRGTSAQ